MCNKNSRTIKVERKHNFWIEGFEKGEIFFEYIMNFGNAFIILICAISSIIFLVHFGLTNPEYLGLVVLLLEIMRLGIIMLVVGVLLKNLCKWWANRLYKKELKILESEVINNGRRKKAKFI
jgi:hypothetical protein